MNGLKTVRRYFIISEGILIVKMLWLYGNCFRMFDDSQFTLRWEIDNAKEILKSGKIESRVFEMGGFKWLATLERQCEPVAYRWYDRAQLTLRCDANHDRWWQCEAAVEVDAMGSFGRTIAFCEKQRIRFDEPNKCFVYLSAVRWVRNYKYWALEDCITGDKVVLDINIRIISSESCDLIADRTHFDSPNCRSDVILLIGDRRLHVSREILSIHSPIFETMFFGKFVENGKEEVELKDVVYEEFLDLLHLIYLGTMRISDRMVPYILKLADQFQMKRLLDQCTAHLKHSQGFDAMTKLLLADKYRLAPLREHCLQSFTCGAELTRILKSSPEYDNLSADTKVSICDRIVNLASTE